MSIIAEKLDEFVQNRAEQYVGYYAAEGYPDPHMAAEERAAEDVIEAIEKAIDMP